jgi:hypothetical protein
MLSARSAASKCIDMQVRRVYLKIDFFHLRQNRDCDRACVDTSRGFGFRHALNTVNAAFKLKA